MELCDKCGALANAEVMLVTKKKRCVTCCIKGYKFALAMTYRENEALKEKINSLKKGE